MKKYRDHIISAKKALVDHSYFQSVIDLFEYDGWQTLPSQGRAFRENVAAFISLQSSSMFYAKDIRETADFFRALGVNSPEQYESHLDFAVARRLVRMMDRVERVPAELEGQFVRIALRNQQIWREAREKADFEMYKPFMKELFELRKQIAKCIHPNKPPYQVMVDMFDEGLDVDHVCSLFGELKAHIPHIIKAANTSFCSHPVPKELVQTLDFQRMQKVAAIILEKTGMRSDMSCYAPTLHPICYCIGPHDVRVTINYNTGIWPLLFTYLHECGHGRYNYSSDQSVIDAGLWGGIDGAMHEGIARFYENMVGKSREFIRFAYPYVVNEFPELSKFSIDAVYHAVNHVQPSANRLNADEVSYSLHPIIRFEMEKDYFEDKISIDDFREIWNEKYRSYLGSVPQNDREGVLQDISWSSGYLGYFQSYALGNLYGAQFREKILLEAPDAFKQVEHGNFDIINSWMKDNIFRYGKSYTGTETVQRITGAPLNTRAFLSYLREKYTEVL